MNTNSQRLPDRKTCPRYLYWPGLIAGLIFSVHSIAADLPYCSDVYSNGLQTYGKNSYILFDYNAQLVNASSTELNTARVESHPWSIRKSCTTDACDTSGLTAPRIRDNRKLRTHSGSEVVIPAHKKITIGENDTNEFRRIELSAWSTAVFSSQHNTYIIDQLDVGYKSSLRLPAGEYWIRDLNMEVESRIDVMGEGTVHLYVLDALQVPMNVKLNANTHNPAQMTLYTYNTAEFHVGTQTYGFVRTENELYLHHRAKIAGGALAKFIDMRTESQVTYDFSAAQKLSFPKICRAAPEAEPGDTTPPEIVETFNDGDTTTRKIVFGAVVRDTGNNASGVASVIVQTPDGEFPMQANGDTYTVELTLAAGDNLLTVIALDHAGNRNEYITGAILISPPRFENLSYPENTPTQPVLMTGEVHSYWPAEDLTVHVADQPVTLIPVSDGVYRFETLVKLSGWYNRFWMGAWNSIGEGGEELYVIFYHPPAFYVQIDQQDVETTAESITLTGTFGIPGEEFNTQVTGIRAFSYTSPDEWIGTIEEINADSGRFSVEVPLAPGVNEISVQVLNTNDNFPWERGTTITRILP